MPARPMRSVFVTFLGKFDLFGSAIFWPTYRTCESANSFPVNPKCSRMEAACTSFYAARNCRSLRAIPSRSARFPCTLLPLQQRLAALQLVLPGGDSLSGVNLSHWTGPESDLSLPATAAAAPSRVGNLTRNLNSRVKLNFEVTVGPP